MNKSIKRIFGLLLHFSRGEQLGMVVLFVLVLAINFAPKMFSSAASEEDFRYIAIMQRIDSLMADEKQTPLYPTTPQSSTKKNTHTKPAAKNSNASNLQKPYTPFTRTHQSMPVVDLNTADTAALRLVRGIGGYYAKKIVYYRERLGGYVHIQQLLDISGVDSDRIAQWAKQLTLDTSKIITINLAAADKKTLSQHPYIGRLAADGIIYFRKMQGEQACTLSALVENNILTEDVAERLTPYVMNR
ncbi:MAG: helix-hairpin-helix domain-containing protein [Prevotellaceae bacterium]|jgi:DNA uptake protein ComE-like DNA-binding protein|nr:helix-hairpin-helix domain-containing protein [Prevotellaceae bacterium]